MRRCDIKTDKEKNTKKNSEKALATFVLNFYIPKHSKGPRNLGKYKISSNYWKLVDIIINKIKREWELGKAFRFDGIIGVPKIFHHFVFLGRLVVRPLPGRIPLRLRPAAPRHSSTAAQRLQTEPTASPAVTRIWMSINGYGCQRQFKKMD